MLIFETGEGQVLDEMNSGSSACKEVEISEGSLRKRLFGFIICCIPFKRETKWPQILLNTA